MITEQGKTNHKAKEEEMLLVQRDRRLTEPFVRRKPTTCVDILTLSFGLAYAELKVQLVAEGSSSTCRAFGVAMAKARHVNVEGSTFQ